MKRYKLFLLPMLLCFIGFSSVASFGQTHPRKLQAARVKDAPQIDGILDESIWRDAPVARGFYQYEPHNDRPASQQTQVRILFDNDALYVGARLEDDQPEKILTELGPRDSGNNVNADLFWIDINPFNDGINGFRFMVSASGVQTDINISGAGGSGGDDDWDAVWMSAVSIDDNGWVVEMKIPYSALRFPRGEVQLWGINFWREIRRSREQSSWNFVNRRIGDPLAFMGELDGIEEIETPVRLALYPYVSSYLEKNGQGDSWSNTFAGGMDLKYGISNSFTMDMTLIPDFGQVQSDARVLNLSPHEVKYDEKRQFFTEGIELFGKADLFYSRRIGSRPRGFGTVGDQLIRNDSVYELLVENPIETRLINATKISGRTSGGLGLGVFNAMTAHGEALVRDTLSGTSRRVTTQPFTNYNVLVADQSLRNNSFVSLINTNVSGSEPGYIANVSGTEFRFMDSSNAYRFSGSAALSQQYRTNIDNTFGYTYDISAGKVGGTWQYGYNRLVYSNTYDPNDLGYLAYNNLVMDKVNVSLNIFDPFWRLLNLRNEIAINYNRLHTPDTFTGFNMAYNLRALFDTRFFVMLRTNYRPLGNRDYFEPRVPGRFFETDPAWDYYAMFSTDYRKRVYLDGDITYGRIMSEYDQKEFGFELEPTFRVTNRLNLAYGLEVKRLNNDVGFVTVNEQADIYFGMRNTDVLINTLEGAFIFNNQLSVQLDFRHYWSVVEYTDKFYLLNEDGRLDEMEEDPGAKNINYNAFTVDMMLVWHFAPGSQLSLAWKNNIDSQVAQLTRSYHDNLTHILRQPQINSLSLRLLYYLDYQKVKELTD